MQLGTFPAAADSGSAVAQAGPVVDWFTSNTGEFISGLLNVVVIIVVALVLRAVAGRLITQLVKRVINSGQRFNQAGSKAGRVVRRTSEDSAEHQERQEQRARTIGSVLGSVSSFVVFGVAFMMILAEFGINLGPILASAGVLGLAIGFGAQALVRDFLSGIFMMAEDQYGVGDVIDTGEAVGTVEAVTLRITKIRDLNGGLWYVRNGEIVRVCNMNQDWANAVVDIPLDYSVDVPKVHQVMEAGLREFADDPEFAPKILDAPEVNGVVGLGDGALTMRVIIKTKPGEQWALGRAVRAHLKQRLDREGVRGANPLASLNGSGAAKQG